MAIDVDTLAEHELQVGDEVRLDTYSQSGIVDTLYVDGRPAGTTAVREESRRRSSVRSRSPARTPGFRVLPSRAFDANTLLALSPAAEPGFDRADLIAADGTDPVQLLTDVAAALPPGFQVVPASELGTREQLRAELEIQRAFLDLLSLDEPTRNAAVEGADQASPEVRGPARRTFSAT